MPKHVRSARGEVVDFELLAIKAQLASVPVPREVEERKLAIDERDGVKTSVTPDIDFLAVSLEAAEASATASVSKQVKRK